MPLLNRLSPQPLYTNSVNLYNIRFEGTILGNRKVHTSGNFPKVLCDSSKSHQSAITNEICYKKEALDHSKYTSSVIFTYSIEHLLKKDKIRFYYALKGRDGRSGIVKQCRIEQLGRAVLLVSSKFESHVAEFLAFWKCKTASRRVLVEK